MKEGRRDRLSEIPTAKVIPNCLAAIRLWANSLYHDAYAL